MLRPTRLAVAVAATASLALAACGGGDAATDDATDTQTTAEGTGAANEVVLTGTSSLKFTPETASASAGDVTFTLTSEGVVHNVVVEGVGGDEPVVEAEAGTTNSATVALDAGEYTFFCNVAGHREAGMEGTLTVS